MEYYLSHHGFVFEDGHRHILTSTLPYYKLLPATTFQGDVTILYVTLCENNGAHTH